MNNGDLIFYYAMSGLFLSLILYVLFGQITVRKLRKSPESKNSLGVELASGWDILNVAQALALPKFITRSLSKSPISSFYANTELLVKSTNLFDRCLAFIFYWLFVISIVLLLLVAII